MPNGGTLNVILHGSFAYRAPTGKEFIDAIIPVRDDRMDHVFRAGNWLGETDLAAGTYILEGVQPGGKSFFDQDRNLVFEKGCAFQPRQPNEHARLILPRPRHITSLRLATVELDPKTRPSELKGHRAASVQVFAYQVENERLLALSRYSDDVNPNQVDPSRRLSGHYWEPVFTGDFANLHIFSAEDHPDEPEHTSEAFVRTAAVLGLDGLRLQEVHRAVGIDAPELPPGVIAEETEDLALRTLRMARLGRLLRQKGDLSQAWYSNEALDGNPEACACITCS